MNIIVVANTFIKMQGCVGVVVLGEGKKGDAGFVFYSSSLSSSSVSDSTMESSVEQEVSFSDSSFSS